MEVTLGIYTSLCQYFSEQEKRWKTEGIIPLEETRPDQAVCLTQHLTAFGASLFVPPNSVQFVFPVSKTKQRLRCHVLSRLLSARGSHSSCWLHGQAGSWLTHAQLADQHKYWEPLGAAGEGLCPLVVDPGCSC